MKKTAAIACIALMTAATTATTTTMQAQTLFPRQQEEIQKNNPTLAAERQQAEATMADNLTGLGLGNPEVGFTYMWGVEKETPNRINVEVMQPFDFATLSGAKKRAAKADNGVIRAGLAASRQQLAQQAEETLIEYIYQSQLCSELTLQVKHLTDLAAYAKEALDNSKITLLEYDQIEMELLKSQNALETAKVDLEAARLTLTALNGGKPLSDMPQEWPEAALPASFDQWAAEAARLNPELQTMQAQIEADKAQIDLRKKEGLPDFSAGYTNELVRGANLHGFAINFSLPLWGNHGRVKAAEAVRASNVMALQTATDQFTALKRAEYDKVQLLEKSARMYGNFYERLKKVNDSHLKGAVEGGTITIFEYMTQQEDFFEHALTYLQARRDYLQGRVALYAPTL